MRTIRLAIAGAGHVARALLPTLHDPLNPVGFGVVAISDSRAWLVSESGGFGAAELEAIARHKREGGAFVRPPEGVAASAIPIDAPFGALLERCGAEAFAELGPSDAETGGPSLSRLETALARGMPTASASKGPLVVARERLVALAGGSGAPFRFSATVGGGMPVLDAFAAFALGNPLRRLECVLNSTSNYVLSAIERDGLTLEAALEAARRAGVAEADASKDLGGIDAASKLVILAGHAFGIRIALDDVEREAIGPGVERAAELARSRSRSLRAVATLEPGKPARVALRELEPGSPLLRDGLGNAVRCESLRAGTLVLQGVGAGPEGTAAAVMRDLLRVVQARSESESR
jgi:homoserine dehydrogenase